MKQNEWNNLKYEMRQIERDMEVLKSNGERS